ncbi:transposase [Candidatus Binatus sp.]|jgi:transposase|uniref:transposase n=1 Tax=Candidatus Binatus sp. TaxID=2811406 RepID=UPI003BBF175A
MDARQQRGMEIAATTRIVKKGDRWIVPSQSMNGKYTVTKKTDGYQCTCPDHELRQVKCKHAFAVEFAMKREYHADGSETVTAGMRIIYAQDWPAYNAAQTSEKDTFCRLLRDLCGAIPEPEQQRGRPRLPIGDALFSATFKVYSTVSARRFMTDLRDAEAKGLIAHAPCYNSIFNVIESETVTPIIQSLITTSSLPLRAVESTFAVDSTGFGLQRFYRHYSAKYGHDQVARDYIKVHAMIGIRTHIVTGVTVTDRDRHDITQFKPLLERTAENFSVNEVLADKAYNSREVIAFTDNMDIAPFIPFRSNCTIKPNLKAPAWDRLFHLYNFKRDEFLAHYHKRSNVESAFSSMKRKFGDFIRSKTEIAQINEVLLKVLAHNIVCLVHSIHELGIAPMLTDSLPTKALGCPENAVLS